MDERVARPGWGRTRTADRWDQAGAPYDALAYGYKEATGAKLLRNRLYQVDDLADPTNALVNAGPGEQAVDILHTGPSGFNPQDQNIETAYNYRYDELGNLTHDAEAHIDAIAWTVAGKVRAVDHAAGQGPDLEFAYGAGGQRISKQVGGTVGDPGTYREHYIRDAQGNVMATYRLHPNGAFRVQERPIYGSSRVGLYAGKVDLYAATQLVPMPQVIPVFDALLRYELTDHLGHVGTVVTGRLLPGNGAPHEAEVISAQGYEPGGSLLPGRNYSSDAYRFGFQGQEKDDEIHGATGTSYTAEFWQYDARVARRWNLDPVPQIGISDYAVFGLNPISNVDPNGAYFFGLIGSTSEQRKAADTYAAQNGGAVIDRHSKNIFVSYTERLSSPGATEPLYALRTQGFGKDGGLLPQHPVLDVPKTDWVDDWSGSDNFLAKASYGFLDKAFGAYQGTPIGAVFYSPSERRHLDGTSASQSEIEGAFFETAGTLMPAAKGPGMFQRLNAAQFSKQFKGNLARMSAKSRGYANRAYNKGVDWLNKGKGAAKMAATRMGELFTGDDAGEKQEE